MISVVIRSFSAALLIRGSWPFYRGKYIPWISKQPWEKGLLFIIADSTDLGIVFYGQIVTLEMEVGIIAVLDGLFII